MIDWRRLTDECPSVVGMMTASLQSGDSADTAIRRVAEEGPELSAELFDRTVRLTDTKGSRDLGTALSDALSGLPGKASGYRHAVMLCLAASESDDTSEASRLLDEASRISLDSVRTMGESYSSSLTVPCTAVFGLGIMLPMILMSIVPLLGIGGMFGQHAVDAGLLSAVTLVAVPAAILAISAVIRRMNPFVPDVPQRVPRESLILLAIPVLTAILISGGTPVHLAMLASVAPISAVCGIAMSLRHMKSRTIGECADGLRDSVFEIGNCMASGDTFEAACSSALSARPECGPAGESLDRELSLCRGDIRSAIAESIGKWSPSMASAFARIYECSLGSVEDAGRLAITLGRQFHDREVVMKELEMKLKSMTDMMVGTAMVFTPLILGMSVSMLVPISDMTGQGTFGNINAVMSLYVAELCALIAVLVSSLRNDGGAEPVIRRFSVMAPVAMTVFTVCCSLSL